MELSEKCPREDNNFVSCHNGVVGALFVEEAIVLCSYEGRGKEGTDQLYDLEKIHAPLALPSSAWQLLPFPETKYMHVPRKWM